VRIILLKIKQPEPLLYEVELLCGYKTEVFSFPLEEIIEGGEKFLSVSPEFAFHKFFELNETLSNEIIKLLTFRLRGQLIRLPQFIGQKVPQEQVIAELQARREGTFIVSQRVPLFRKHHVRVGKLPTLSRFKHPEEHSPYRATGSRRLSRRWRISQTAPQSFY